MGKVIRNQPHQKLFENIKALLHQARNAVARNINTAMVMTYFEIGRMIVEHEQKGARRAEYAKETLKSLSQNLTSEFGRGFSVDNLQRMRSFYLIYMKYATVSRISAKQIPQTASAEFPADQKSETLSRTSPTPFQLSWSHYVFLMRLPEAERRFYEIEAVNQNWSLRELERQFNSSLYERLALSRDNKKVRELSEKGHVIDMPHDTLKEPYVLEFLGLKEDPEKSYGYSNTSGGQDC